MRCTSSGPIQVNALCQCIPYSILQQQSRLQTRSNLNQARLQAQCVNSPSNKGRKVHKVQTTPYFVLRTVQDFQCLFFLKATTLAIPGAMGPPGQCVLPIRTGGGNTWPLGRSQFVPRLSAATAAHYLRRAVSSWRRPLYFFPSFFVQAGFILWLAMSPSSSSSFRSAFSTVAMVNRRSEPIPDLGFCSF